MMEDTENSSVSFSILPVNRISNGYLFNSQRKSRKLKIEQSNDATALCMMDVRCANFDFQKILQNFLVPG